ncbi:hypothetical protein [Calothrix sp. PCC 6303]|jgi:hypothetical protein|uniref:hypothetical protein n=1 Tax=Calothrix sp. PCC 6303 TaxID=1170562 RepID=UPI0002A04BE0|nr:hypothetical protein [Calothrix sp. PCC 6303]AFZ01550.1 hypothetical protein Cal6303_2568 [Calothrix sp. PCC 6303]
MSKPQIETMPLEENVRLNITISRYNLQRLKYWAAISGKTPSAYASQIISARLEVNFDLINQQLEDLAQSQGMTLADLKELLDKQDSK